MTVPPKHSRLYLTDGGVLENLGVERLLASSRFAAKRIIVSDAGLAHTCHMAWRSRPLDVLGCEALSARTRRAGGPTARSHAEPPAAQEHMPEPHERA